MEQEGVMTGSSWSLWSFYRNSSSPLESVGARSPESPSSDSDSGKTWTVSRSNSETCAFMKRAQGKETAHFVSVFLVVYSVKQILLKALLHKCY